MNVTVVSSYQAGPLPGDRPRTHLDPIGITVPHSLTTPAPLTRRMRTLALGLAAGLLAIAGLASAPPATAAGTGITISGHVTEAETGSALKAVDVVLYPEFSPADGEGEYGIDWASTTSTGSYSFTNVKPGKYRVSFEPYNHPDLLTQYYGGVAGDRSGEVDAVEVSASTTVDQALVAGGAVTGRVVDSAGLAVKKAEVTGLSSPQGVGADHYTGGYTDSKGRFNLRGLPAGDITLYLSGAEGSTKANIQLEAGAVQTGDTLAVGDIVLPDGSSISGIATKSNGSPLKKSVLFVFPFDADGTVVGDPISYAPTSSTGAFTAPNLPVGDFVIANFDLISLYLGGTNSFAGGADTASAATRVTITASGSKVYRDIRFEPSAKITGTVKDAAGKAAKNVRVLAVQNDYSPVYNDLLGLTDPATGDLPDPRAALAKTLSDQAAERPAAVATTLARAGFAASTPVVTATTSSKGTYTLSGAVPGASYTLLFGERSTRAALSGATAIVPAHVANSTTVVNARLSRTVSVKGVVSSAGKPRKNVSVEAIRQHESAGTVGSDELLGSFGAVTDSKGRYTLKLPAGKWVLRFADYESKLSPRFLGGGTYATDPRTTVLDTAVKSYSAQDIALGSSGATIAGDIVTSTGSRYVEGDLLLERIIDGEMVDETYIDNRAADGYFLGDQFPLRRIVDGDYRLRTVATSYYDTYVMPDSVTEFSVRSGVVTLVDGVAPQTANSLGTIELPAAERVVTLAESHLSVRTDDQPLVVGTTLEADIGEARVKGSPVYYQWFRDASPIGSAFGSTYVIQPGDAGSRITFGVTTADSPRTSYLATPRLAPYTDVVEAGETTLEPGTPTISGTGALGAKLTAVPAATGEKHSYQWRINGVDYRGATASTFTPRIGDLGDTISVAVTTDGGDPVVSNRVVVTKAAPVTSSSTTAAVLVGGKAMKTSRLGAVLTAKSSLPTSSLVVSYQWEYATTGSNWAPLRGKNSPTLTLSKKTTSTAKIGYSYRVVITAERAGTETGPAVTSTPVKVTKAYKKK